MTRVLPNPVGVIAEYTAWLPRHRTAAGKARVQLRSFLADIKDGDLYLEVGELVLTELVTNAVRHAQVPPGRQILVRFARVSDLLRIEVHDASSKRPVVHAVSGDDEAGRGLWLVEQLTDAWGCDPRTGGIGKTVWCLVAPATPGGAAGRTDHDVRETVR